MLIFFSLYELVANYVAVICFKTVVKIVYQQKCLQVYFEIRF